MEAAAACDSNKSCSSGCGCGATRRGSRCNDTQRKDVEAVSTTTGEAAIITLREAQRKPRKEGRNDHFSENLGHSMNPTCDLSISNPKFYF